MKFPHKSSVARVVHHRGRGEGRREREREDFSRGFARCLRVSATSVAGRINQNAGHSLAGRAPTPEISHFCPRNASIYIIFPINSSGEPLPTRLGTLLHRTYAPSFHPRAPILVRNTFLRNTSPPSLSSISSIASPAAVKNYLFYILGNVNLPDGYIYIFKSK